MNRTDRDVRLPSSPTDTVRVLLDEYQQAADTLERVAVDLKTSEARLRALLSESVQTPLDTDSGQDDSTPKMSAGSALEFYCFGKFHIEAAGRSLSVRVPSKSLKLLKFLLLRRRRPATRDLLAEALWPEIETGASLNRLRVAVHALRLSLRPATAGRDLIVFRNGSYELDPDIQIWVDADEFESLWQRGVNFESTGDREKATRCYESAGLLYRGEYLEEELYDDWALLRRESLRDAYLHLLGRLADWAFETRSYSRCVSYCHKILDEDPYREDTYRLLMNCYAATGQKSTVAHWYRVCRTMLRKGLDGVPSGRTVSLYQRIMSDAS